MDDLISRQAAIDAIEEVDWYHQNKNKDMVSGANSSEHQAWYKADDIYKTLEELPSAQPSIDAVPVIRCHKCVHWMQNTVRQNSNDAGWWNEALCEEHSLYGNEPFEAWTPADWFCGDGERKEDGTD